MTMRLWLALAVVVVLLITLKTALGFEPEGHHRILHMALDDQMDPEALNSVIAANDAQDIGVAYVNQTHSEFHFDNAAFPDQICDLWNIGVGTWFEEIVQNSAPKGDEKRDLKNRQAALKAFGKLTHAVEDFYSHSNAVELWLLTGRKPSPQILVGDNCDWKTLDRLGNFYNILQTGYFDLDFLPDGCPATGPPEPFKFCHYGPRSLNKDKPGAPEGAKKAPDERTYYDLAVELATEATRAAWEAVHDRIVHKYEVDKSTDAECLFMKLAWGKDRTCHRLWKLEGSAAMSETPTPIPMVTSGQGEVSGFEAHISWQPQRYPGPKAPPVYTEIGGTWTINGPVHETLQPSNGWACTAVIDPIYAKGNVTGRIKVVPEQVPPEFAHLWDPGSTNPFAPGSVYTCRKDGSYSTGGPTSRGIFFALNTMMFIYPPVNGTVVTCLWATDPLTFHRGKTRVECKVVASEIDFWMDIVINLDEP